MKSFKKQNLYIGWGLWFIATSVYFLTLEPTVSFWDCGEFIASGFKLEVGHPPGAPLFMLLARFFSLFAGDNVAQVALLINSLSALASSFTILFLFWTVTRIAQKVIPYSIDASETVHNKLILATGILAAISYTFTDTFWFSAVEGEVYALSSLFTAVVFWAILKWEEVAEQPNSYKWLVLIAYLMGLSIGVHLLNLLAIPAIVFVFYFKKNPVPSKLQIISTFFVSLAIVGTLMWIVIPGIPKIATWFDLLFVNSFNLPVNSGFATYCCLLIAVIITGLYITHIRGKIIANTIILVFTAIVIGYSSYGVIVIRSLANTPMDENNPENPFSLLSYLNRDQYGQNPLLYGNMYNAPVVEMKDGNPIYTVVDGKYKNVYTPQEPVYDKNFTGFFPRMWSNQEHHIAAYKQWAGIEDGKNTESVYVYGQTYHKPTFAQNLKYFFSYQMGHMYFRYFMWNFAGRQNDLQGNGEPHKGNWISGIGILDNLRLGPQDALPDTLKANKGQNTYFFLPLLLGLAGMIFLWRKSKQFSLIITLLFIFTGIAIVIYLNQYPLQPRERDYAYAGSFYAFAIWIGFGIVALYEFASKYIQKHSFVISVSIAALCPIVLAAQNWDDHNRSNRYIARDFASNYLQSCEENAILFTYGDNDTFPLWYAQEVEGIRTDVRVVNLSLFNTDWYIQQMKRKAYDSDAIPSSLTDKKYMIGTNEQIFVLAHSEISHMIYPVKDIIQLIGSTDSTYKARQQNGSYVDYFPVPTVVIPVDKQKVLQSGMVAQKYSNRILPGVPFSLTKNDEQGNITDTLLTKSELMMFDILANFNWERPIYFSTSVGSENFMNLHKHLFLEGLAYKLMPLQVQQNSDAEGEINTDVMYANIMNKFAWGNIQNPNIYIDENIARMAMNYRNIFSNLAQALIKEKKIQKARNVLDKCIELFPNSIIPYDYFSIAIGNAYKSIGDVKKAHTIHAQILENIHNNLLYYMSVKAADKQFIEQDVIQDVGIAIELFQIGYNNGDKLLSQSIAASTTAFMEQYFSLTRQVTICNPELFEQQNSWVFQLTGNLPYVAYWYNTMKIYIMSDTQMQQE